MFLFWYQGVKNVYFNLPVYGQLIDSVNFIFKKRALKKVL